MISFSQMIPWGGGWAGLAGCFSCWSSWVPSCVCSHLQIKELGGLGEPQLGCKGQTPRIYHCHRMLIGLANYKLEQS